MQSCGWITKQSLTHQSKNSSPCQLRALLLIVYVHTLSIVALGIPLSLGYGCICLCGMYVNPCVHKGEMCVECCVSYNTDIVEVKYSRREMGILWLSGCGCRCS